MLISPPTPYPALACGEYPLLFALLCCVFILVKYLGGLFDLTGEINRYAVARATERDTKGVKECLETVLVVRAISNDIAACIVGCDVFRLQIAVFSKTSMPQVLTSVTW